MPRTKHPLGPKINAGISLRQIEIDELKAFAEETGLESVSEVVVLLKERFLSALRWSLATEKSSGKMSDPKLKK